MKTCHSYDLDQRPARPGPRLTRKPRPRLIGTEGALTARQQECLDYLRLRAERGQGPAILEDVCEALGLRSTASAWHHVDGIVRKGYARRRPGWGGVELVEAPADPLEQLRALVREASGAVVDPSWHERAAALGAL